MSGVHVVVPDGIDDPERPSGGNTYDRRICRGLAELGWAVDERAVPGSWPRPDRPARADLAELLAGFPDGEVVLLDGLVASTAPDVLVPEAGRLRLVPLVHMPLGDTPPDDDVARARGLEGAVLSAAAAVVATSDWTRRWLLDAYALDPELVHVAEPGVDTADVAPGTEAGGALLCVGAYTHAKGYDVLLAALALVADLPWRCVCVGTSTADARFVEHLGRAARRVGIDDRLTFTGPLTGEDLARAYATSDLLVVPSRAETYGMVVTEALARGLPVIATEVGGIPEALGSVAHGVPPGVLVPSDDPWELSVALRSWLTGPDLRRHLRAAARERRTTLCGWSTTSTRLARVLAGVDR